jgi:phosphoribosylformylglycinamidine synthase
MIQNSRIEFIPKSFDSPSKRATDAFKQICAQVESVKLIRVLTLHKSFDENSLNKIARAASNPVTEDYALGAAEIGDFDWAVEIGFLPGVTDNVGSTSKELISDLLKVNFEGEESVFSSYLYFVKGQLSFDDLENLGNETANKLIQRVHIKSHEQYLSEGGMDTVAPIVKLQSHNEFCEVDLNVSNEELEILGKKGIKNSDGTFRGPLALSVLELQTIRDYFNSLKRKPTDLELESIAQTWSEHCKHKIFAAPIDEVEEGLYKGFIKKATNEVRSAKGEKDFCVSVFKDNAGAIEFNEKYLVTDKAETHNSPSALDPFGGAITGIVGVNRDCLGFGKGAKPIANRYGFCFADPRDKQKIYREKNRQNPMLLPEKIVQGVIKGVESGGNESGIPSPQGFIYFHERYKGKPLVFVGTVGLIPRLINGKNSWEKQAQVGDLVVVIGGRVGQDGIHGATFSSESLDFSSPSTAVQIGDPITQKRFMDAILTEARDLDLYNSITDNGAGGISCSVAEMAKESGGFRVDLAKVPLKYPNLEAWKIWISESQERMTLAIAKEKLDQFDEIMKKHGVEMAVIGEFTDSGMCEVFQNETKLMDMSMDFLHEGVPLPQQKTSKPQQQFAEPKIEINDLNQKLLEMTARLNLSSFSAISTRFDHEVQGTAILKPLQGKGKVSAQATVYKPDYNSTKAIVMSQGLNPLYSEIDSYYMAACAIDTAIRNAVSVGANIDHMALMDNFCWCSSLDPERLYQLKEACRACYDYATAFGSPFISGKDSMFNDFSGFDENSNELKISVPPTLLISSLGVMEDARQAVSMDLKITDDLIYTIGITADELGGSEFYNSLGLQGANVPKVDASFALRLYRAFYQAIKAGVIASSISVGLGGLASAFVKKCLAGELGAEIDLKYVATDGDLADWQILFSESQSRFVVSVNPALRAEFENFFADFNLRLVGKVTAEKRLSIIGKQGNKVINLDLESLGKEYFAANKFY